MTQVLKPMTQPLESMTRVGKSLIQLGTPENAPFPLKSALFTPFMLFMPFMVGNVASKFPHEEHEGHEGTPAPASFPLKTELFMPGIELGRQEGRKVASAEHQGCESIPA
jgi:hypothetical protein